MKGDFEDYGYKDECHLIYSGKDKDFDNHIGITTWQSMARLPRTWFQQFDCVIVDECLHPDSKIKTIDGEKRIEDVKVGDLVLTMNEDDGSFEYKKVIKQHKNLSKHEDMYEITTDSGTLTATGNHQVYTQKGWVRVDELTENDYIINT
jgi:intein/homing endonuclease